ncbi:MAG: ribonuclease H family protein [Bacteroidota bacterium]
MKQKFYVVWKGKETGVFSSWDECKNQIDGFSGAEYKSFKTKEAAERAFEKSSKDFIDKTGTQTLIPIETQNLTSLQLEKIGEPILESISVDSAYNGKVMEYRGVYTKTKKVLFSLGHFEDATNNIGEFLAIVHALGYLKKQKSSVPIYSDSTIAIHWIKIKKVNTNLKPTPANKSLFYLIERAEKWLRENEYPNRVIKWKTEIWGENPADFGRK